MKYATDREYADPEKTARKLLEIANTVEPSRTVASISRRSTARFCSRKPAPPPNTRPALRRVNAALARTRAKGTKLGRRRVEPAVEARILELKASGDGILKIGRKLGIGTSVVQRVFKQEPRPS